MKLFTIPNILSLSRIVFLPLLYFFAYTNMQIQFLVLYIIIGSTDAFDGFIARKLNQVTKLGKDIDSLADLLFFVSSAIFIYMLFPEVILKNTNLLIVFFIILLSSFIISYIKLGRPVMMHTILLKTGAILVYIIVILSFFFNTVYLITGIIIFYYIAYIEEIVIFLVYGKIDPDTKSIFHISKKRIS